MIEELLGRLPQSTIRMGLERIEGACAALGEPQGRYPSVIVAGTNGKGSTCAFLASILEAAGLRVGLYTSPHLVSFRERIRIAGEAIAPDDLEEAGRRLVTAWPALGRPGDPDALTYFEAATALAFDAFAAARVDVAILEVGLGGRLDATNVSGKRLVAAAVTRVGLDHVEYLGSTLRGIAAEKAAVARAGVPLVSAPQRKEALEAIRASAGQMGAPLVEAAALEERGGALAYTGPGEELGGLQLGLRGEHQRENAAVAIALARILDGAFATRGGSIEAAIPAGLRDARWPGRLEVLSEHPLVVIDGAHNPDGAAALASSFSKTWPGTRPQLVFGVLGDKDRLPMMRSLFPLAGAIHVCPPPSPRAVPAADLAEEAIRAGLAGGTGPSIEAWPDVAGAVSAAMARAGREGAVLICGSLYSIGAARALLVGDAGARSPAG
ncbi:MAG TPA: folylpolyglutamate synthase/dihydrofolate synthase family protein [Vulgatibacter sp.]